MKPNQGADTPLQHKCFPSPCQCLVTVTARCHPSGQHAPALCTRWLNAYCILNRMLHLQLYLRTPTKAGIVSTVTIAAVHQSHQCTLLCHALVVSAGGLP